MGQIHIYPHAVAVNHHINQFRNQYQITQSTCSSIIPQAIYPNPNRNRVGALAQLMREDLNGRAVMIKYLLSLLLLQLSVYWVSVQVKCGDYSFYTQNLFTGSLPDNYQPLQSLSSHKQWEVIQIALSSYYPVTHAHNRKS